MRDSRFGDPESQRLCRCERILRFRTLENPVENPILTASDGLVTRRFLRFAKFFEIKLQKGVDPTQARPYMPLHRRGADGFNRLHRIGRQHQSDNRSPGENRGAIVVRFCLLDGSLTLLDYDEGTCGRRRPVRGPQGLGNRLTLSRLPHPYRLHRRFVMMHVHSYPLRLTVQVSAP